MTAKNRRELKQLYRTGAQPTEQDYADVFDSVFNQIDDGVLKPLEPHLPLRIKGNGAGLHVLDLYDDDTHNWRISLLANTDSGYNIADPTGNSHFFLEDGSGNVGLGATQPKAKLHINQSAALGDAVYVQDATGDVTPSRISNDGNVYIHSLKGVDGAGTNATASVDSSLYVNGSVNVLNESVSSTPYWHINGSGSVAINGQAVGSAPHLQVNCDSQFAGSMEITQDLYVVGKLTVEQEMEIKATVSATGQTITLGDHSGDQVELPGMLRSGTANPLKVNDSLNVEDSFQIGASQTVNAISNSLITGNDPSGGHGKAQTLLSESAIHRLLPKGTIVMWSGNSVPTGWALCDGGTHNGLTTPDLRGRFIVGSGGSISGQGGSTTKTLGINNLPAHDHNVRDSGHIHSVNDPGHSHGVNDPGHSHHLDLDDSGGSGGLDDAGESNEQNTRTGHDYTGISIASANTDIEVNSGTSNIIEESIGSGQAFDILPPYYTLSYIIKITG